MATDITHVVEQLPRAGLRPSDRQWELIRSEGVTAVEPLLALALDVGALNQPEPAAFGPLHALRLLGELPAPGPAAIERLLKTFPAVDDASQQATFLWWQELPQIVAHWGRPALEAARQVLLDPDAGSEQRAVAAESLAFIVELNPELRGEVTELLRERLANEADPYVMAHVVEALSNLGVHTVYSAVMDAYKRGVVDKDTFPASEARQRLLNPKNRNALVCVHHSLAERYEQHGPFTEEQRQLMADNYRRLIGY